MTDAEHDDVVAVARLVGLSSDDVDRAFEYASSSPTTDTSQGRAQRFRLQPGNTVVFTGKMRLDREQGKSALRTRAFGREAPSPREPSYSSPGT